MAAPSRWQQQRVSALQPLSVTEAEVQAYDELTRAEAAPSGGATLQHGLLVFFCLCLDMALLLSAGALLEIADEPDKLSSTPRKLH